MNNGSRLYLTADERTAFRAAARAHDDRQARTFCQLLLFTGCRISESLEVIPERFDWQDQAVMFHTLKKRGRKALTSYRAVPLPTLQQWMGHSDPKTTAIYMQAVGEEARLLAGAAW